MAVDGQNAGSWRSAELLEHVDEPAGVDARAISPAGGTSNACPTTAPSGSMSAASAGRRPPRIAHQPAQRRWQWRRGGEAARADLERERGIAGAIANTRAGIGCGRESRDQRSHAVGVERRQVDLLDEVPRRSPRSTRVIGRLSASPWRVRQRQHERPVPVHPRDEVQQRQRSVVAFTVRRSRRPRGRASARAASTSTTAPEQAVTGGLPPTECRARKDQPDPGERRPTTLRGSWRSASIRRTVGTAGLAPVRVSRVRCCRAAASRASAGRAGGSFRCRAH